MVQHTPNYCAVCTRSFPGNKYDLGLHLLTHAPGRYRCDICDKALANPFSLRSHQKLHTGFKPFACSHCPMRFYSSTCLRKHARRHGDDNKKNCQCPVCGKMLSATSHLRQHMRIHTRDFRFVCAQCPSKFTDKRMLRSHVQCHVGCREFACQHCSASFLAKSNLGRHVKIHVADWAFSCTLCRIGFQSGEELKSHQTTVHTQSEPKTRRKNSFFGHQFSCNVCSLTFRSENALASHGLIHESDRKGRYSCSFCLGRMDDRRDFIRHIITSHYGGTFRCPQCTEVFHSANMLARHEKLEHRRLKTLQCKLCTAKFFRLSDLRVHFRVHTGEKPYSCKHCPARYAQVSNLHTHVRIHARVRPHQCDVCDMSFVKQAQLNTHKLVHASDGTVARFGCALCQRYLSRRSDLVSHIQTHNDSLEFSCNVCAKRFGSQQRLSRHYLRNVHSGLPRGKRKQHLDVGPKLAAAKTPHNVYECAVCSIRWTNLALFTIHFQQHRAKPPGYPCSHCGVVFETSHTLGMDREEYIKRFQCRSCPMRFSAPARLRYHVQAVHPTIEQPRFQCLICGLTYTTPASLKQHHLLVHAEHRPFNCRRCAAAFRFPHQLKRHMVHHNAGKAFGCAICCRHLTSAVNLQAHLKAHYSAFPLTRVRCAVCQVSFKYKSALLAQHLAAHASAK